MGQICAITLSLALWHIQPEHGSIGCMLHGLHPFVIAAGCLIPVKCLEQKASTCLHSFGPQSPPGDCPPSSAAASSHLTARTLRAGVSAAASTPSLARVARRATPWASGATDTQPRPSPSRDTTSQSKLHLTTRRPLPQASFDDPSILCS